jgi:hypothetical protein
MDRVIKRVHLWLDGPSALLILLALGVFVRLVFVVIGAQSPLVGDSAHYVLLAKNYLSGDFTDTYWPPGISLYESAWMFLFGDGPASVRASMLPWFVWLAMTLFALVSRIHSRAAGNLSVLLLCVYPEFVHFSVEPLTQLPAAACLCFISLQAITMFQGGRVSIWLVGFSLGFLVLLRPSFALLSLVAPLFLYIRTKKLAPSAGAVVVASTVVMAWVGFISAQNNRVVIVNESNSRNFYLGNNPWTPDYKTWYLGSHWEGEKGIDTLFRNRIRALDQLPLSQKNAVFQEEAWSHIKLEPRQFFIRTAARIRTTFVFDTFTASRLARHHDQKKWGAAVLAWGAVLFSLILWLSLSMLWGCWQHWIDPTIPSWVFWMVLAASIPYFLAFSHPTYHLPFLPLLLGLGAIPLVEFLSNGLDKSMPNGRGRLKIIVLALVVLALQLEWMFHMMP